MFKTHRTYDLSTGVKNNSIAVLNNIGTVYVTYYKTVVFFAKLKRAKGTWEVTMDNGGWDTISTKIVINRALEQIAGFNGSRIEKKKIKSVSTLVFTNSKSKSVPFTGLLTVKS